MADLNYETNGRRLGELLAAHDELHGRLTGQDPIGEVEAGKIIQTNVELILECIGIRGLRGLTHIAFELLDIVARRGVPLTDSDWLNGPDGQAFTLMVQDLGEAIELVGQIGKYRGLPLVTDAEDISDLEGWALREYRGENSPN